MSPHAVPHILNIYPRDWRRKSNSGKHSQAYNPGRQEFNELQLAEGDCREPRPPLYLLIFPQTISLISRIAVLRARGSLAGTEKNKQITGRSRDVFGAQTAGES